MYKFKRVFLPEFLEFLQQKYMLYAPVKSGSESEFKKISSFAEIDQSRLNTTLNPKEIFFPRAEVLFSYDEQGIIQPDRPEKPVAVWGLRTCDTKSIRMLNEVFANARQFPEKDMFKDPYWINKYQDCLLISEACNEPLSTCFCNWFGSGPFDETGSDIFVIKGETEFFLQGVTSRGEALLAEFGKAEPASENDFSHINDLHLKAEAYLAPACDLSSLKEKLDNLWDSTIWEEIGEKCLNCGACAYICPTCHCFDVSDEAKHGKGKRLRLWDACMFSLFTKEASGHNPRSLSLNRVRQRIMHKYNYFVENYQKFLCTGCGRCVMVCPVNLDIREALKKILAFEFAEKDK